MIGKSLRLTVLRFPNDHRRSEGADKLCIILEFCPHGSLKTFLGGDTSESNGEFMEWDTGLHALALGVAECLRYLHHDLGSALIHRDIKPDNVLVGKDISAKVADFGESKLWDAKAANEEKSFEGDKGPDALTMTMVGQYFPIHQLTFIGKDCSVNLNGYILRLSTKVILRLKNA